MVLGLVICFKIPYQKTYFMKEKALLVTLKKLCIKIGLLKFEDFIKIQKFCSVKDTINQMGEKSHRLREKYLQSTYQ